MSVKYHLSINGPNRELLGVQAEGEGDGIYAEFLAGVQDLGLDHILAALTQAGAAVAVAGLPARAIASQPAPQPWGQPPVQPMQQFPQATYANAAPQMPAAAVAAPAGAPGPAPVCQHGQKLYREGVSAQTKRAWSAWFCPAPGNDPTQCQKEWLR